ncbi:uncharacterized protein K452DRAFT_131504 [Aplosporella prunicola CBS 121167]|uniref:Uncharacterized protein n=1 Tax=Aplosporella prunicola CBS 121167 TaxID=1176127 RepID=A0A6A6BNN1_9PEZI|nr:uncharacterized protein K452DRAFT_131504 [Aplosporella prunicola CBS 121167]KAF2144875.1 hypothetical protein K452DRAFT_131504 [Aplosporella prunicola CBS 121167]
MCGWVGVSVAPACVHGPLLLLLLFLVITPDCACWFCFGFGFESCGFREAHTLVVFSFFFVWLFFVFLEVWGCASLLHDTSLFWRCWCWCCRCCRCCCCRCCLWWWCGGGSVVTEVYVCAFVWFWVLAGGVLLGWTA